MKIKKNNILPIVLLLIIVFLVIALIVAIFNHRDTSNPKDYIIERQNSTLVVISYGDKSFFSEYDHVIGYIDDEVLDSFSVRSTENIKVYHPYKQNHFVIVPSSSIKEIVLITDDELVSDYPPSKYAK